MKRRQLLQTMAITPVVAALSRVAEAQGLLTPEELHWTMVSTYHDGVMQVVLNIFPMRDGTFAPVFEHRVKQWETANGDHFQPRGNVTFEPIGVDGKPWLLHSAWGPPSTKWPHGPAALFSPIGIVFGCRHWSVIDRGLKLREETYWNQLRAEDPPITEFCQVTWDTDYLALPGQPCNAFVKWREQARAQLSHVVVKFEAVSRKVPCCERDHDGDSNCDRHRSGGVS
jgi:hypothetical protein